MSGQSLRAKWWGLRQVARRSAPARGCAPTSPARNAPSMAARLVCGYAAHSGQGAAAPLLSFRRQAPTLAPCLQPPARPAWRLSFSVSGRPAPRLRQAYTQPAPRQPPRSRAEGQKGGRHSRTNAKQRWTSKGAQRLGSGVVVPRSAAGSGRSVGSAAQGAALPTLRPLVWCRIAAGG